MILLHPWINEWLSLQLFSATEYIASCPLMGLGREKLHQPADYPRPLPFTLWKPPPPEHAPSHTLLILLLSDIKTKARMDDLCSQRLGDVWTLMHQALPPPKSELGARRDQASPPWTTITIWSRFHLYPELLQYTFILTHRYLKSLSWISIFYFEIYKEY